MLSLTNLLLLSSELQQCLVGPNTTVLILLRMTKKIMMTLLRITEK